MEVLDVCGSSVSANMCVCVCVRMCVYVRMLCVCSEIAFLPFARYVTAQVVVDYTTFLILHNHIT